MLYISATNSNREISRIEAYSNAKGPEQVKSLNEQTSKMKDNKKHVKHQKHVKH